MFQNFSIAEDNTFVSLDFMKTPDHHFIRYGKWYCNKEEKQGSILLLNGRKEFLEKYTETIGELNQRGYDVYSLDWRGQGLSSRMLGNRQKGYIEDYNIYLRDLNQFVREVVQPEAVEPFFIIAHSMGGHIALRFIHDHPKIAEKAVLTSPMFDIRTPPLTGWMIRLMTRVAVKLGFKQAYTIGSSDYTDEKFEGNSQTSDPVRFMDQKEAIAKNSDLALGGVTYGWLSAAFDSIDIITQPDYGEKISTPVLIVGAGDDEVVSNDAQKKICRFLINCRRIEIPGARHEIFKETDAVRSIFWNEFDGFVHKG